MKVFNSTKSRDHRTERMLPGNSKRNNVIDPCVDQMFLRLVALELPIETEHKQSGIVCGRVIHLDRSKCLLIRLPRDEGRGAETCWRHWTRHTAIGIKVICQ